MTTLHNLIRQYLAIKKRSWRDDTMRGYQALLGRFERYFEDKPFPPDERQVMDFLLQNPDVANETIRTYYRHIAAFFNYLCIVGTLDEKDNPMKKIRQLKLIPRKSKLPPIALTEEESNRLFAYLEEVAENQRDLIAARDLALIRFGYLTGCRASEICRLEVDHLNLDELSADLYTTKSHKHRLVYYNQQTRSDIESYLKRSRLFVADHSFVFISLGQPVMGHQMTSGGVFQMWKRRLREAGIPHKKFHALRHTSAVHAIESGIPLHEIKAQLGHDDLNTTAMYLRGRDKDRARYYSTMGEAGVRQ